MFLCLERPNRDAAARAQAETVKELKTRVKESNQAARNNAAAASEAREQHFSAARARAEEIAALNSQNAETRDAVTTWH